MRISLASSRSFSLVFVFFCLLFICDGSSFHSSQQRVGESSGSSLDDQEVDIDTDLDDEEAAEASELAAFPSSSSASVAPISLPRSSAPSASSSPSSSHTPRAKEGSPPETSDPQIPSSIIKSFLSIGDWGVSNEFQRAVAQMMGVYAEQYDVGLILALGDNFYERGVASVSDPLFKTYFEDVYTAPSLNKPWLVIAGNHDHYQSVAAQIEYSKKSTRWQFPALYYTQTYNIPGGRTMQVVATDSVTLCDGDFKQLEWIKQQLASSTADYLIVIGHYPIFSGGEHGDNKVQIKILKPLLEQYKVTFYACGHDHSLQHLTERNVHYFVSGAGAKRGIMRRRPQHRFGRARNGFMLHNFNSDGSELSVSAIDWTADVIYTVDLQPRK